MDEYARAAEDFCRVIEAIPAALFLREIPSADPDTVSIRALCRHAVGAAHRYADYILQARGLPFIERFELPADRSRVRRRCARRLRTSFATPRPRWPAGTRTRPRPSMSPSPSAGARPTTRR